MRCLLISAVFLFTCGLSAQKTCYIKFTNLFLVKKEFKRFEFTFNINGQILKPDSLLHIITLNEGLDTVQLDSKVYTSKEAITRFKAGETYEIVLNPCSYYELRPVKNPQHGKLRFGVYPSDMIHHVSLDVFQDTISRNKGSVWMYPECSAMCCFSPKDIQVFDDDLPENNLIHGIQILFLHGEKYEVTFPDQGNLMKVNLIGYLTEKEKKEVNRAIHGE